MSNERGGKKGPKVTWGIPQIQNDSDLFYGMVLKATENGKKTRGVKIKNAHDRYVDLSLHLYQKWGRSPIYAGSFMPAMVNTLIPLRLVMVTKREVPFENSVVNLTPKGRNTMKRYLFRLDEELVAR